MKTLTAKIAVSMAVTGSIACVVIAVILGVRLYMTNEAMVREIDSLMRSNFDRNARLEVETAISMMKTVDGLAKKGVIKEKDSRDVAMSLVASSPEAVEQVATEGRHRLAEKA